MTGIKREQSIMLVGVLLIAAAALPVMRMAFPLEIIAAFDALVVVLFALVLFRIVRACFGREWKKYAVFFSSWMLIVQAAIIGLVFFDPLKMGLELFVAAVVALVALSLGFRFVFGKKETEGIVLLSDSGGAGVKIEFDLFAGLNAGKYVVGAGRKYGKGEKVRIALKRKMFRKAPDRIIGKA